KLGLASRLGLASPDGLASRLGLRLRFRLGLGMNVLNVEHLLGDRTGECEPRSTARFDQDLAQPAAGALLLGKRSLEINLRDLALVDQDLADRTSPHEAPIGRNRELRKCQRRLKRRRPWPSSSSRSSVCSSGSPAA